MKPKELHTIWFRPFVPTQSNMLHLGRLRLRRGISVFGVTLRSRDNSVGVVTRLQAERLEIRIPPGARNCPFTPKTSRLALRPTQPEFGGILSWGKSDGAWRWPLTSMWCRDYQWVQLCLCLHYIPYIIFLQNLPFCSNHSVESACFKMGRVIVPDASLSSQRSWFNPVVTMSTNSTTCNF
jgi:hypothetical protein